MMVTRPIGKGTDVTDLFIRGSDLRWTDGRPYHRRVYHREPSRMAVDCIYYLDYGSPFRHNWFHCYSRDICAEAIATEGGSTSPPIK